MKCGCPHGCKRQCDDQARCPFCWNKGAGCPVLFHGKTDPAVMKTPINLPRWYANELVKVVLVKRGCYDVQLAGISVGSRQKSTDAQSLRDRIAEKVEEQIRRAMEMQKDLFGNVATQCDDGSVGVVAQVVLGAFADMIGSPGQAVSQSLEV